LPQASETGWDLRELARIVEAWPALPEHIKTAVLTMVDSVQSCFNDSAERPKLSS
jgi:hypothetical protein